MYPRWDHIALNFDPEPCPGNAVHAILDTIDWDGDWWSQVHRVHTWASEAWLHAIRHGDRFAELWWHDVATRMAGVSQALVYAPRGRR